MEVPESDADLLVRLCRRDEEAFRELIRRHGALVWSACRSQLPCEADAEDAFQATYLVLHQRHRTIRQPGRLSTWL